MPYPAVSIGNSSAVQMGSLLTILLLCVGGLTLPWRQKSGFLYALIMAPLLLSIVKATWFNAGELELCFKAIIAWSLAGLTMMAVQIYAPRYGVPLLVGIAAATLVHAAVGLLQLYSFSNGEFPLLDLYVNQSFTSVQENAFSMANYMQRPFGIFPEPSAMASSLAPFVLLWVAEMCGVVHLREQPARWQRVLFAAAAAGGIALIIMSRSGHTIATLAGALLFGLSWLFKARATRQTFGVVAGVFGVVLPLILWWGAAMMTNRVGGEWQTPNSSWDDRSTSLIVGLSAWAQGGPATIFFGLGVGLGASAVYHASGINSIWSVLLAYLYETGVIGIAAVVWIGTLLFRVWRTSRFNSAFVVIALVWLLGVTFVTSYPQLLPNWVALGWLVVWPSVCVSEPAEPARKRIAISLQPDPRLKPRNPLWTDRKLR